MANTQARLICMCTARRIGYVSMPLTSYRPLTEDGEERIRNSAKRLIGDDTLILPKHIKQVFVSPRQRALRTLNILELSDKVPITITDLIEEWDYGDYEGFTSREINEKCGKIWNVFRDGCPHGDTENSITERVDELIRQIRLIHATERETQIRADVLIVAHGHILRAFAARWIKDPVTNGTRFAYGAGGAVSQSIPFP